MKFTRKGYIEVLRDDVFISRHTAAEEAYESAYAHAEENGGGVYVIRYPNRELDLSSIAKYKMRFLWASNPVVSFAQGTAASVDLAQYVTNPLGLSLTYSVASGALPTGCTLSGSTVSYNGTAGVSSSSVSFTVTDGAQSSKSATITAQVITAADTQAPTVPVISFTGVTSSSITINWTAATDNVAVTGYTLQRSTDNATWTTLYDGTARAYTDSGRVASTLYYYRVRAYDAAGNQSAYGLGQTSTSAAGWGTVPDFTFTLGTASSQSFGSYIPVGESFDSITPPLPAGLSVSGNEIVYDGTTGAGNYGPYVLSSVESAGSLPVLALSGGGTGKPWTFGHAFKKGDVPAGYYITASGPSSFQADVRNYWDDGSVKFAVLSGIGGTSAVLSATLGTAPTGEVALVDPQASVTFSGDVTGTYACPTSDTVTAWDKATAHLVRKISGPVMTERHYYVPTTDDHVAVWFYVRSYLGGAAEVEIVVENGWFDVAAPGDKTYGVTVTVNGTTRYSNTLTHYPRTRWATINWLDGTNGLTDYERVIPLHDNTYFRSTKLVPNFVVAANATQLASMVTSITPMGNANMTAGSLGGVGYGKWIGLLPQWDAAHVASSSATTYKAVMANAYACNTWPTYYRDENTGRPLAFSDRPLVNTSGWTGGSITAPASHTTTNPSTYNDGTITHEPAAGYLSYLLTGRWSALETTAFWAAMGHMWCNPVVRGLTSADGSTASHFTGAVRGRGWHLRQLGMAIEAYPDTCPTALDQSTRDDMLTAYGGTFTKWQSIGLNNSLGVMEPFFSPTAYNSSINLPDLGNSFFMEYFFSQSIGFLWDLELTTGAENTAHQQVRDHTYKLPVGTLGDGNGWCYRYGPQYVGAVGTYVGGTITFDSTWKQAFDRTCAASGTAAIGTPEPCTANATILSGNFPVATSYGANLLPSIVYAVDHGATGAADAYARYTSASNYADFLAGQSDAPQFAVVPR